MVGLAELEQPNAPIVWSLLRVCANSALSYDMMVVPPDLLRHCLRRLDTAIEKVLLAMLQEAPLEEGWRAEAQADLVLMHGILCDKLREVPHPEEGQGMRAWDALLQNACLTTLINASL